MAIEKRLSYWNILKLGLLSKLAMLVSWFELVGNESSRKSPSNCSRIMRASNLPLFHSFHSFIQVPSPQPNKKQLAASNQQKNQWNWQLTVFFVGEFVRVSKENPYWPQTKRLQCGVRHGPMFISKRPIHQQWRTHIPKPPWSQRRGQPFREFCNENSPFEDLVKVLASCRMVGV